MNARFSSVVTPDQQRVYRIALWLLTLLAILPIWLTAYNPLLDLPMHLGRIYVEHAYDSEPYFQSVFGLESGLSANMGIDIFSLFLPSSVDPVTVGKLFLSMYILLFVFGCERVLTSIQGR